MWASVYISPVLVRRYLFLLTVRPPAKLAGTGALSRSVWSLNLCDSELSALPLPCGHAGLAALLLGSLSMASCAAVRQLRAPYVTAELGRTARRDLPTPSLFDP